MKTPTAFIAMFNVNSRVSFIFRNFLNQDTVYFIIKTGNQKIKIKKLISPELDKLGLSTYSAYSFNFTPKSYTIMLHLFSIKLCNNT